MKALRPLTSEQWWRLIDEHVVGEGDAAWLYEGRVLRKGSMQPYVFSPDQVARAAEFGIEIGPSWLDVILQRPDLRAQMHRRLADEPGTHAVSYTGALHVRRAGSRLVLADTAGEPPVEEWVEHALHAAGVLDDADAASGTGRPTEPVTLTLLIERRPTPPS